MANIFRKLGQRIFGRKQPQSVEEMQLQRREDVERARAQRAQREAEDAHRQAEQLGNQMRRRVQGQAASRETVERQRQEVLKQARREQIAREIMERSKREVERLKDKKEQLQIKAREALLRTEEGLQRTNEGAKGYYKNKKVTGAGELPDRDKFLRGYTLSRFASSNVLSLCFDPTKSTLHVQYLKSGRWFVYYAITKEEALMFYGAASKGVAVWDQLRVRGNRKASRKRFKKDVPPPDYLPILAPSEASESVTAKRQS